jgi:23S rRNA (guanine2445-N2)-methyltransferase / 23S rRNA (guanine2069-N7)-methyltransferase
VFLELGRFEADTDAAIYAALRALDWNAHVDPRGTLACEWSGRHPAIANTHFGTLRLKDAICDTLRDATGLRPSIATEAPCLACHGQTLPAARPTPPPPGPAPAGPPGAGEARLSL